MIWFIDLCALLKWFIIGGEKPDVVLNKRRELKRELAIEYAGRDDLAHVAVEESDFDPYSISKPEMSDVGLVRNQGEKREVQYTLDSVSNLEDSDMRERRIARETVVNRSSLILNFEDEIFSK